MQYCASCAGCACKRFRCSDDSKLGRELRYCFSLIAFKEWQKNKKK
jgi:hypothetical protein